MTKIAYKGCTLPLSFGPVKDTDGDPVDLTGATVVCKARPVSGTATDEITASSAAPSSTPTDGKAVAEFTAGQTAAWALDSTWQADAIATLVSGKVVPLGPSIVFIIRERIAVG